MNCSICLETKDQWVTCGNCRERACEACTLIFSRQSHKAKCTLCGVPWVFSEQLVCRSTFEEVLFEELTGQEQLEQCAKDPAQILLCVNKFLNGTLSVTVDHQVVSCIKPGCVGVVSEANRCVTCQLKQCHICNTLHEQHDCDVNMESDYAYAVSGCIPCPNCFQLVAKGDGCQHVTCDYCHVPFSWDGSTPTSEIQNDINDLEVEKLFGHHCFGANRFIRKIHAKLQQPDILDEAYTNWQQARYLVQMEIGRYYVNHDKPTHNEATAVRRIGRYVTQQTRERSLYDATTTWLRLYQLGPAHLVGMPNHYMKQLLEMLAFAPPILGFTLDGNKLSFLLQLTSTMESSMESSEQSEPEEEEPPLTDLAQALFYGIMNALLGQQEGEEA